METSKWAEWVACLQVRERYHHCCGSPLYILHSIAGNFCKFVCFAKKIEQRFISVGCTCTHCVDGCRTHVQN